MNQLTFTPEQRILVKLGHPDDETLVEPVIKAANEQADTVHVLYDTIGESSTVGNQNLVKSGYRAFEALRSLALLGIPPQRVHFGFLPDGNLDDPDIMDMNSGWTTDIATKYRLNTYFTMGRFGIDGHFDHMGSHRSGVRSAMKLGQTAWPVDLFAVNANHQGAYQMPVDIDLVEAMQRQHVTQNLRGRPDEMAVYGDILTRQVTFDHILRGSMVYTISRIRETHEALQYADAASR